MTLRTFIAFIAAGWPAAIPAETTTEKPVYRDAATHDDLLLKLRKDRARDPMLNREEVKGEDPSTVNRPVDLLKQSDIISFGGLATLVPKRAVLAAPATYQRFLKLQPGDRIVGWAEFYRRNRGWITTVEVSRVEAEGNQKMPDETLERIAESRNLIVATCMGGPISVLPLKESAVITETATAER